ncbi:MAG: M24 family metallopeptidase [Luteitalea sp.]|nr:M24 family metallopeptidase [Luteitalea sp.]
MKVRSEIATDMSVAPAGVIVRTRRVMTRRPLATSAIAALLVIVTTMTPVEAGSLQDDLVQRRARVMSQLDANTMLILWSAPTQVYSHDVDYEYRQDSDLLYLTGIEQEGTMLVLMPGNRTKKSILFIHEPNARREHWEGHLLTKAEAHAASGVNAVHHLSEFEPFLTAMMNQKPYGVTGADGASEYTAFSEAVAAGRAKVALKLGPRPAPSAPLTKPYIFARDLRERFLNVTFVDAQPIVWALRQVKTPYEQSVLRTSVEISSEAHMAGMRAAAPGKYEYQVRAAIEHVYMDRGAMSWGYPSIVGSGPNALILHYTEASRRMEAGDLLLVDAAANYQGLTGDITRTYPVSGRFTDPQKDLYRLVVEAQDAGRRAAAAAKTVDDVRDAMSQVLKVGLLELGLITDAKGDQFRRWATHGTVHWIGMDVHDVGDLRRPLEPGMAFVMEPGVYIRQGALDALPDTPENRRFKEKVAPTFEKYEGIGIRVEDSFLLTDSGLVCLSAAVPRTLEEVEAFLVREGAAQTVP